MFETITRTPPQVAISIEHASELSSLSKPFLRLEIKRGNLKSARPGDSRRVLIMMSDFLNYLKGEKTDKN